MLKESIELELKESINKYKLIVWNDDINTFDHVINCLNKYCGHTLEQAEQCSLIIHFRGKCDVKRGEYDELKSINNLLIQNNLTSSIE